MLKLSLALFICSFLGHFEPSNGHGRLIKPASRNAMWRYGFPTPVNYNDNEVWCGGVGQQYGKHDGKCGICGDDFGQEQPRDHEAGGKYGTDVNAARYVVGQTIDISIDLTTNHGGYFEIKLCDKGKKNKPADEACFEKYTLELADKPGEVKYVIPEDTPKKALIEYRVKLPDDVTCSRCVFQWTYVTGNTWGKCEDGSEAVGCGNQETFRNCADISIHSNTRRPAFKPTSYYQPSPKALVAVDVCVPNGLFKAFSHSAKWCQENCLQVPSNCPKSMCRCLGECKAIGRLKDVEGTDVFCHRKCLRYPSDCPEDVCHCTSVTPAGDEMEEESKIYYNGLLVH